MIIYFSPQRLYLANSAGPDEMLHYPTDGVDLSIGIMHVFEGHISAVAHITYSEPRIIHYETRQPWTLLWLDFNSLVMLGIQQIWLLNLSFSL